MCAYVSINILLPYYIKVTNLKTVLTYKQIKVKQSPLNGLNIMWHVVWAAYMCDALLRYNQWWAMCGSRSWQDPAHPPPMPAAAGRTVNTPRTVYCKHNMLLPMHQNGPCVSISFEDLCQHRVVMSSLKSTPLAWLGILFHTKWKGWNVSTGIFLLTF